MKIVHWTRTAEKCGMVSLFFTLAFVSTGFSQPIKPSPYPTPYPVIGPYAAPMVRIISPANHSFFLAPVDIPIFAYARDLGQIDGFTNVEFYAGTNDLGPGRRLITFTPIYGNPGLPYSPINQPEYTRVWTNPPPGVYALTAVARRVLVPGGASLSVTSAPVTITVLQGVPPPTNKLEIVSIVATDPVAIEGTNCWVSIGTTNATPAWTNWPPLHWSLITNCGPKSATFTVRRFGDASSNLVVNYNIGGTASNGVDYVTISNNVTIPAGDAYAQITIVPIDDGTSNRLNKTVVLTLTPGVTAGAPAGTPPEYIVGLPSRAAAVIFEDFPRPFPYILADSSFHVNAVGPDGAFFVVEYSSDMLNWTPVCTNQVVQGSIDFVDPDAAGTASRFYRAVPQ